MYHYFNKVKTGHKIIVEKNRYIKEFYNVKLRNDGATTELWLKSPG